MVKTLLSLSCLFLLLSHDMATPVHPLRPDTLALPCLQKAEQLLNEALTFMEKNYYRRDQVIWTDLEAHARQQLLNARQL